MNLTDRFTNTLDSLFLAMFAVWTLGIAVTLLTPQGAPDHQGTVEIYSLTAVDGATPSV